MSTKLKTTAALMVMICTGLVYYAWQREQAPVQTKLPVCHFETTDGLAFSFKLTGATEQNAQALANSTNVTTHGKLSDNTMSLAGDMRWEVQGRVGTQWLVHAQLQNVAFNRPSAAAPSGGTVAEATEMLGRPFAFTMNSQCRFIDFGFSKSVHPDVQSQVRALMQSMEFVLPTKAGATNWVSMQTHALGKFKGSYTAETPAKLKIERKKELHYEAEKKRAMRKLNVKAQIENASFTVERDATGKWATLVRGGEKMQVKSGSVLMAKMQVEVLVQRTEVFVHHGDIVPGKSLAWQAANAPAVSQKTGNPQSLSRQTLPPIGYTKLMEIVQDLIHKKDFTQVWQVLRDYFRAYPELIAQVMDDIHGDRLNDLLESWAIMALGKAGTPEAQQALRQLLEDDTFSHRARYRGVVAHVNMENVETANLDSLLELGNDWGNVGEGQEQVLATSSRHMIGNQLSVMNKNEDARAEQMRDTLASWLEDAAPGFEKRVSIKSVGNSGDERFFDTLKSLSEEADDRTREIIYHAMRFMDSEESHDYFLESIQNETSPDAMQELSETIASQSMGDVLEELVRITGERLLIESNADIRYYLVNILGSAIEAAPEARAYLVQRLKIERVLKVVTRIGEVMASAGSTH